jgi:AraC-like DNA-binding protein
MEGVRLFDRSFPANQRLKWPERNVARFCVVMGGHFTEHIGRIVKFSRGDVLYRPPDTRNLIQFGSSGMRSITIELVPEAVQRFHQAGVLPKRALSFRSSTCVALATRIANERVCTDSSSQLIVQGLILELFGEIGRCGTSISKFREPDWLKRVHSTISSEFTAPRTLEEYAELGGVHPTHLMRTFRAHFGISIGKHIRHCRLNHAVKMICSSDSRLADIAALSGFADHSHMTNCFRNFLGLTPSEYRRLSKKG